MAWITPVTNRPNKSTRTTAADINRICNNINYLWASTLRTNFTSQDIVTRVEWDKVVNRTNEIADLLGLDQASDSTLFTNLNYIESIALAYWNLGPLFPEEDLYPAEDLYPR